MLATYYKFPVFSHYVSFVTLPPTLCLKTVKLNKLVLAFKSFSIEFQRTTFYGICLFGVSIRILHFDETWTMTYQTH
uniref:Uncharacterized protein n=1 Tax=Solanum lycopersicum TaxID=4081 RepID=A0A3Q7FTI6_SOLLC